MKKQQTQHLYSKEDFAIVSTPFNKPLPKGVTLTLPKAKQERIVKNDGKKKFIGRPVDNTLLGRIQADYGCSELGREISLLKAGAKKIRIMG